MVSHSIRPVRTVVLALALIAACAPARSQQPSASAVATAKELITLKGGTAIYEPIVPGIIERARRVLLQSNPMLGKPLGDALPDATAGAGHHNAGAFQLVAHQRAAFTGSRTALRPAM